MVLLCFWWIYSAGSLGGVASTGVVPLLGGVTAAYWGGIARYN